MFKIEKNIPMLKCEGSYKYPFPIMKVGDSFFVPLNGSTLSIVGNNVRTAARYYHTKNDSKFTVRKADDGVRVWRIK